ncbi:hypothetical protein QFC19_002587 [Naganishia cerealis]|uniref:Uncharacterized protein n=1 Tax=Naganishia cerealis TaxID=610337 RepID=A0ACC2WAJ0_9TREE|nr:hypothetical protein QFC19_002587 [Naganishia cerealis]
MTGLASAQEQVDRHGETEDAPRRDIEAQMNPGGAQRRGSDASDCTVTSPSTLPVIVEELNPSFELDPQLNTATPTPPGNNNMNGQPQISASTTPVSDTIDPENAGTRSLASIVDLPLVHVSVPFPSMMAPLHGWLYNPSPPILLASLLDIPRDAREPQDDSTNTSSTSLPPAVRRLSALSVHSIFVRMQRIHKLWSNTVALGVIDEMLWKVMDRAWDCFVSALKLKGGEAVYEVSLETASRGEWGLDSNSEVVRKFSMATIRDANSSAGSVSSTSS